MDPNERVEARKATTGRKVRALREGLGLTQETFGALVGQSRVEINHIENGRRGLVHHDVRVRFAEGLRVPVPVLDGYLVGEVSEAVIVKMVREGGVPKKPEAA